MEKQINNNNNRLIFNSNNTTNIIQGFLHFVFPGV